MRCSNPLFIHNVTNRCAYRASEQSRPRRYTKVSPRLKLSGGGVFLRYTTAMNPIRPLVSYGASRGAIQGIDIICQCQGCKVKNPAHRAGLLDCRGNKSYFPFTRLHPRPSASGGRGIQRAMAVMTLCLYETYQYHGDSTYHLHILQP